MGAPPSKARAKQSKATARQSPKTNSPAALLPPPPEPAKPAPHARPDETAPPRELPTPVPKAATDGTDAVVNTRTSKGSFAKDHPPLPSASEAPTPTSAPPAKPLDPPNLGPCTRPGSHPPHPGYPPCRYSESPYRASKAPTAPAENLPNS